MQDEIVYGVIPRNVGPEGCKSVTAQLDDLQALGITAIWLAPINSTPPDNFGYAVTDYFDLRPDFGTKDDFRALVEAAHARKIRVMMDFVPNHSSDQHPYYQDALAHGTASEYYDYYDRDASGAPTHYFHWTYLPNLNYDNLVVERWMLDAFAYWVREFDVDGFRVDVAWGIRQRKPDFWPKWRRELHAIRPDLLLLAEASARDSYYFTEGFDAAYDWTDELGHWAWEKVWEDRSQLVSRLHAALTNEGRGFHQDAVIFRFLNNNDTGERFITRYGVDMTRVATALLLTLPGVPCVYLGDEVGAEFHPYQTSMPIAFEDRHGLREYHRQLIRLRKELPALRSLKWLPLEVDPSEQLYGFLRYPDSDHAPVLVLLNFSGERLEAEVRLPDNAQSLVRQTCLMDMLTEEEVQVRGSATLGVPMQSWSARILRA